MDIQVIGTKIKNYRWNGLVISYGKDKFENYVLRNSCAGVDVLEVLYLRKTARYRAFLKLVSSS